MITGLNTHRLDSLADKAERSGNKTGDEGSKSDYHVPVVSGENGIQTLRQPDAEAPSGAIAALVKAFQSAWSDPSSGNEYTSIPQEEPKEDISKNQPAASKISVVVLGEKSVANKVEGHKVVRCDLPYLPRGIIIRIMEFLPPLSLWSLRQASVVFFHLFRTPSFTSFHADPGLHERHPRFNRQTLAGPERDTAVIQLQRDRESRKPPLDVYCDACCSVQGRGERDPRMIKLRALRYCEGCRENHAGIFFEPEARERYDRGEGGLLCLGMTGKLSLCGHVSKHALMWRDLDRRWFSDDMELPGEFCRHRSHQGMVPPWNWWGFLPSSIPRISIVHGRFSDSIDLKAGWTLPLLQVDGKNPPSVDAIRETLGILIGECLRGYSHKPCRHMRDGRKLRDFAQRGICQCFTQSDIVKCPRSDFKNHKCWCDRKPWLCCADCGAVYNWRLDTGRISLHYSYEWSAWKPTSLAWLNLLDGVPERVFNEDNRHLLWCDSPGCPNATGRRRDDLVKEETWLQRARYGDGRAGGKQAGDHEELFKAERERCSLPRHTGTEYDFDPCNAKALLEEIRLARLESKPLP